MVGVRAGAPRQGDASGRGREREDAVVGEQHRRLGGGTPEQRHVVGRRRLGVRRGRRSVQGPDAVEPTEQAADGRVEVRLVDVALLDGVDHGRSEAAGGTGHFEVEPGAE